MINNCKTSTVGQVMLIQTLDPLMAWKFRPTALATIICEPWWLPSAHLPSVQQTHPLILIWDDPFDPISVVIKYSETSHQPSKWAPIRQETCFGGAYGYCIEGSVLLGGYTTQSCPICLQASDHGPIPATPSASAKPAASMVEQVGIRWDGCSVKGKL